MNNKGADQAARMRRLICTFVVRIWHKTHFCMDGWVRVLRPFNSISVISRRYIFAWPGPYIYLQFSFHIISFIGTNYGQREQYREHTAAEIMKTETTEMSHHIKKGILGAVSGLQMCILLHPEGLEWMSRIAWAFAVCLCDKYLFHNFLSILDIQQHQNINFL